MWEDGYGPWEHMTPSPEGKGGGQEAILEEVASGCHLKGRGLAGKAWRREGLRGGEAKRSEVWLPWLVGSGERSRGRCEEILAPSVRATASDRK